MKKITKILLTITALGVMTSCNGNVKALIGAEIQEIDGCQYIVSRNGYGNVVSHKGNCKNPIHYKLIHDTIYVLKVK